MCLLVSQWEIWSPPPVHAGRPEPDINLSKYPTEGLIKLLSF